MKKIRIVADDKIPFLKGVLEDVAEVRYLPGSKIDQAAVHQADALIIRTRTHADKRLLSASSVKFIATATIGFDHIDTGYCENQGIYWTNAPGCNSSSVEQYIVSALLAMAEKHGFLLKDKTLGIVGVGNVGSKVAHVAKALGMSVLLNDPPRERIEGRGEFSSLNMIKDQADIITFHVPLNKGGIDNTFHLAERNFFSELKKKMILINTSRGEVVEGSALKEALKAGRLKDAVLDVWENEPGPDPKLLELTGIATPHIAGYSVDGKANGTRMSVRALSEFFNLGLENWEPGGLPLPEIPNIVIDCGGMSEQEIIGEVYRYAYDIMADDEALRFNISRFEELRGNYPVRREPLAFTLRLNNNAWENLKFVFSSLGFSLLEPDCFC